MGKEIRLIIKVDDRDLDKTRRSTDRLSESMQSLGSRGKFNLNSLEGNFSSIKGVISSFTGNLAADAVGFLVGKVGQLATVLKESAIEATRLGADFEQTRNALAAFSGSTTAAENELSQLSETARNTAGLRLIPAEEGLQRLRGLGFEATRARKLIKELSEEKVLSGASDDAFDRVIFNFTQIQSGGQKISQEIRELLTAMPSLRRVFLDAFDTLNPQKIQSLLDSDPSEFFDKLISAMEKSRNAQGGLNNAIGKFYDELIRAGREFSKPFIPELTKDIELLTRAVGSQQSVFKRWGQGVNEALINIRVGAEELSKILQPIDELLKRIESRPNIAGKPDYIKNPISQPFGLSRADIDRLTQGTPIQTDFGMRAGFEQFKSGFDSQIQKQIDFIEENKTNFENMLDTLERLTEIDRQKAIKNLEATKGLESQILQNSFDVQQAKLDSHLRFSATQELNYIKEVSKLKQNSIQQQIAVESSRFAQLLELNKDDKDEVLQIQIEKQKVIGNLNKELQVNEFNTQKQIAEKELQILDERRKNYLEFKELQEREFSAFYDKQAFYIERGLEKGVISTNQGYDQLIEITKNRTNSLIEITKDEYTTKLADSKLNAQEIINLTKERDLKLADLAEQNSRQILSIEDNRYQKSLELIDKAFSQRRDLISSYAESTQFGIGLLSPDSFGINSTSLIQRALTGSDLATLENSTKTALEKARLQIQQNLKSAEIDLNTARTSGNKDGVVLQSQRVREFSDALTENSDNLKNWGNLIDENVLKVNQLVEKIKSGNGTIQDFDTVGLEALKLRQQRESQLLDEEIASYDKRIRLATDAGNQVDAEAFTYQKLNLERRKTLKGIQDEAEQNKYLSQTIQGLTDTLNALKSRDKVTIDLLKNSAQKQVLDEQIGLYSQNIYLQERLAKVGEDSAVRYKNAWLDAVISVKEKNIEANESIIRSQVELADKTVYSSAQVNAKVLDYLNRNIKSVSESVADFKIAIADEFLQQISSPFDALKERLEGLPPLIKGIASAFLDLAKDIIRAFSQKLILRLLGLESTGSSSSGLFGGTQGNGGFNFGNILGSIKQVLGIGGNGGFRTPSYNPNSSGNFFANNPAGLSPYQGGLRSIWDVPNSGLNPSGGNSFFGKGGIFGKEGFGNNVGTYSVFGVGANVIGSLIGGRVGGFISGAGTGLAMGAQIGTMIMPGIGTAIGAVAGAIGGGLMSLLGGDPKRKRDKNEKLPQLNKVFADSLQQLRELGANKSAFFDNPEGVMAKALELRAQIASGGNIVFESKKYQGESQKLIASKLIEADTIIAGLEKIKDKALLARDVDTRLQTRFATGVYLDSAFSNQYQDFKRRNGMLAGTFTGKDYLPSLLADGEMVLNAKQIKKVKENAGFDVFRNAGIPNYNTGIYVKDSSGNSTNGNAKTEQVRNEQSITIVLQGDFALAEKVDAQIKNFVKSTDGSVKIFDSVQKESLRRPSNLFVLKK